MSLSTIAGQIRANLPIGSALVSISFKNLYNTPSYGGISLYCTMQETHVYESKVSQYPVQSGSTLIDNVIQSPTIVRMRALVTDTPIGDTASAQDFVQGTELLTYIAQGNVGLVSTTVLEALVRLQDERIAATLVTGIKVYENMVLTKMTVPRDSNTGQALFFDLEFSEIMQSNVSVEQNSINEKYIESNPLKQQFAPLVKAGSIALQAINSFKRGSISRVFGLVSKVTGLPNISSLFSKFF